MSEFLDRKWITEISLHLEKFKWTGKSARFRCPICGDSQKSLSKTRGNFYTAKNSYFFKCFNCGESSSFSGFLKSNFPSQYREYRIEKIRENSDNSHIHICKEEVSSNTKTPIEYDYVYCSSLSGEHEANRYLKSRKIFFASHRILFEENFREFVQFHIKEKNMDSIPNDKRIIFPLYDPDNSSRMIGCQGRSIDPSCPIRYITIKFYEESIDKIYGIDKIDWNKQIFVTEGPIDSLFLPNSLAACQGDIPKWIKERSKYVPIVLLDNEPRHKDTVNRMQRAIDSGYQICIWNGIDSSLKDINDMILHGNMTAIDILRHVKEHTFSGLRANIELGKWKRI